MKKNSVFEKNRGFSIIELMVAITFGLLVLASITSVMVSTLVTNSANLKMIRLDQELRTVMLMMTRNIRRAGSSANAVADVKSNTDTNPFDGIQLVDLAAPTVLIYDDEGAAPVDAQGDCILFSYDLDDDGVLDANEAFGFRLDSNDGAVEIRQGGANCSQGGWQNLTDELSITITNLDFAIDSTVVTLFGTSLGTSDATITVRDVTITLTGEVDIGGGQTASRTLEQTIRVRNDDFDPAT